MGWGRETNAGGAGGLGPNTNREGPPPHPLHRKQEWYLSSIVPGITENSKGALSKIIYKNPTRAKSQNIYIFTNPEGQQWVTTWDE